jgi:hypothetical protein
VAEKIEHGKVKQFCLLCGSPEIGVRAYLTLAAASAWLGCNYHTLSDWLKAGGAKPSGSSTHKLFRTDDIVKVMAERERALEDRNEFAGI